MTFSPLAYASHGLLGPAGVASTFAIRYIEPSVSYVSGGIRATVYCRDAGAIQGGGFVTIGGVNCTVISWSNTIIVIEIPPAPGLVAGAYNVVVVTNAAETDTLLDGFLYIEIPASAGSGYITVYDYDYSGVNSSLTDKCYRGPVKAGDGYGVSAMRAYAAGAALSHQGERPNRLQSPDLVTHAQREGLSHARRRHLGTSSS